MKKDSAMTIKACVSVGLHTIHVLFIHAKTRRGNYILLATHFWMPGIISSCTFLLPSSPSFLSHLHFELQLTSFIRLDKNNLPVFVL